MKRTGSTSNRRGRQATAGVSLFPFLAVLICTMGALILLLVILARQAQVQAARATAAQRAAQAAAEQQDLQAAREDVQWRLEQLRDSREQTEAQLEEARLELGHIEDHTRRLRQQMADLEASWSLTKDQSNKAIEHRELLVAELAKAEAELEQARRRLAETQQAVKNRKKSYAIVPYRGPHGTFRRPIYLECRGDKIVLQPEGIELTADDFDGPMGPGNPLATTLRAAREHMLRQRQFDPNAAGEPYPLLLVRPNGIDAYYAARMALKSWGTDFGYELVEQDWELQFPAPDAELADALHEVLQTARVRQNALAETVEKRHRKKQRQWYRATPTRGGVVRYGDGGGSGRGFGVNGSDAGPSGGSAWEHGPGADNPDGYQAGNPNGSIADRYGSGYGTGSASDSGHLASGTGGSSELAAIADYAQSSGGLGGNRITNPYADLLDQPPAAEANHSAAGRAGMSGTGISGAGISGSGAGTASTTNSADGTTTAAGTAFAGSGTPGLPGSASGSCPMSATPGLSRSFGSAQPANPGDPDQADTPPEGYVAGRPPRETDGQPSTDGQAMPLRPGEYRPRSQAKSLADVRGHEWALRNRQQGSVPITRAIRVDCYPDRLVLVPERGLDGGQIIGMGPQTSQAIDPFVAALWHYMDTWGMAGQGMYWRPVLNVRVAAGAEPRFTDLMHLLEGSGLTVRRKQ